MTNRITHSKITDNMTFREEMFLAGYGDRWEYRPVRPLVHVGDDGPPAPFDAAFPQTMSYEPEQVYLVGWWDWLLLFGMAVLDLVLLGGLVWRVVR